MAGVQDAAADSLESPLAVSRLSFLSRFCFLSYERLLYVLELRRAGYASIPHFQDFLSPHIRYAKIWKHAGALSTAVAVVVSSVLQRHDVAKSWENMSPGQACRRGEAHQSLSRLDIGCDFEVTSSQHDAWKRLLFA